MSTLINNFDSLQNSPNASGAPWFQVVRPEDVDTIPDVILDQISSAITLVGGATAYNMKATVGTVQWSETTQEVGGRLQYTSVFSFVIPKDRADVLNYAKHLNNRGVIAIVRDANGQNRLMGTAEEPATFQMATRSLGHQQGGRNEHRYEIVLVSGKPVPFYQVTAHLPSPAGSCPVMSVSVGVSDTTPTYGDAVTITATPANFSPTLYRYYADYGTGIEYIGQNGTGTYVWNVRAPHGSVDVYVEAIQGAITAGSYTTITVTGLFLDRWPSAVFAFSLYRLRYGYAGACLRVRRASDNAEQDIGFDIDSLDITALETFCTGTDGYVVALWCQQVCNMAVQLTASDQPQIVSSGSVITKDGYPAIDFDGTNDHMDLALPVTMNSAYVTAANDAITEVIQLIIGHASTTDQLFWGGTGGSLTGIGTNGAITTTEDTDLHTASFYADAGANDGVYVDAGADSSVNPVATATFNILGHRGGTSFYMNGKILEVIIFDTDQWVNKTDHETDITNRY